MPVPRRGYAAALVVFVSAILVVVTAWARNDWDLKKTALVGESAAPIVGILSLIAVVAALWSVRIQMDALGLQQKGSQDQQASTNELLRLQREALEHQKEELLNQREALEAELRYRRHTALREAYAPFVSAVHAYLDTLHDYFLQMLRAKGVVDRRLRSEWQRPCETAHEEVKRTLPPVLLVDTNEERQEHRWRSSMEVRLEPWVDTSENQRDWIDVVQYRTAELSHHYVTLRALLHREFGAAVAEKSVATEQFDEALRADLKEKADVIDDRISAQLHELAKAEAVRTGQVRSSQRDDDGGRENG
jgi:hypothetical protein